MEEGLRAGSMPVSDLVEDEVVTVPPEANLVDVAETLLEQNIGAVVVGAQGTVTGILSERDVVRAVAEGRDPTTTLAADVASTALVWCDLGATVAEVALEMMDRYVRHVLVEADGVLVGIVSARDLLGVYGTDEPWGG